MISIDTKKKEWLGNFHRAGTTFTAETVETFDHDFGSAGQGKLMPHGLYDLVHHHAHLHLNTSHDTSAWWCDSVALWWEHAGRAAHPQAKRLLVLGDGGGSTSATQYLCKEDLQGLANRLGLEIRMAHYPPYCSKYNPIEPHVFPHITRACQGVIFHTVDIAATMHRTGAHRDWSTSDSTAPGHGVPNGASLHCRFQTQDENCL